MDRNQRIHKIIERGYKKSIRIQDKKIQLVNNISNISRAMNQ